MLGARRARRPLRGLGVGVCVSERGHLCQEDAQPRDGRLAAPVQHLQHGVSDERPELGARGMRGSKPAGFSGVGERAARSLDRVYSRCRGPRRAAGASLEQRDLLDDVRRVREHSRGNDAGERWWER